MQKLDRKLFRDLSRLKGQAIAIIMVIVAGVATFVMSLGAYVSLESSRVSFYRDFRFADVFAAVRRSPDSMIARIEQLPGVAAVETRLVYDVLLDVPEMSEPATARLISTPEAGRSELNQIYISRGRMLEPGRTGEVVVSEAFADAHEFIPGDEVEAILNGKRQTLTIVGMALSPEYVIQVQPGSIVPDDRRFGVFWINERDLEAAFDMDGAFNSVSLKLAYGSHADAVIAELDRLLGPFGNAGAYDRDQQLSHQYVSDELAQVESMAWMAPAIFLSVAAFLLNIVLSRIISQQREQIAALKAFGYTNYEVGLHYLNLILVIALSGAAVGTLVGFWMAINVTEMYQRYYRFPVLEFQVSVFAVAAAWLLTTAAALIGTFRAVGRAVRLPPAEAMRPEPPPAYRPTWIERLVPAQMAAAELRMVIRNIARKPVAASLSILGIAMAVAVMVLGNFSLDAVNYLMDFQFRQAQRQDLTVTFVEPAAESAVYEVRSLPGVIESETIRSVPVRLRFRHRSRRVGLMGLETQAKLYRLLDVDGRPTALPPSGIVLNSKLAELLNAGLGDVVVVEALEGKRPTFPAEVAAIIEEYAGLNAYMDKEHLHRRLEESPVASGAFLAVDPKQRDEVFQQLESRPRVASVAIKEAVIESFRETMAEHILVMRLFIVAFAAVIAVGVVYNNARISLSERSRDLATMRVIGFTRREVSIILLGEIGIYTAAAIPLGWLIGYLLAAASAASLDTDNYRIPLVVSQTTLGLATAVVVVSTLLSGAIVERRIARLDLIGVLKTRE